MSKPYSLFTIEKILLHLLLLLLSIHVHAQRDRVQIQHGTVVTDKGTLMRGAYFSTDWSDEIPSEGEISVLKTIGLNALHLYAECPAFSDSAGSKVMAVDSIVNMTARDSIYLLITIGNCGEEGSFDSAYVNDFWRFYAPRYRDRTHVVFEIMNEPFAWGPPYDSLTIAMERRAYDTIRYYAPESHVQFMSYSWPENPASAIQDIKQLGNVDWSNASIASHGYTGNTDDLYSFIHTLNDSGYAVTFTEFESIGSEFVNLAFVRVFEAEFISYLHFLSIPEIIDNPAVFVDPVESSEIRWKPDFGTWPENLTSIDYRDPYQQTEAGFFDEGSGFKLHYLETTIGYINDEDYAAYYNFDFREGPDSVILECAAGNLDLASGSVELRLDSLSGEFIGNYPILHTNNWEDYRLYRFAIEKPFEGKHAIYFVFHGNHEYDLMNLKSFRFAQSGPDISQIYSTDGYEESVFLMYPNPASSTTYISTSERGLISVFTLTGTLVFRSEIRAVHTAIPLNSLKSGNYFVLFESSRGRESKLLSVE